MKQVKIVTIGDWIKHTPSGQWGKVFKVNKKTVRIFNLDTNKDEVWKKSECVWLPQVLAC